MVPGNCGTHRQSNDLGDAVSANFEHVANLSLAAGGDRPAARPAQAVGGTAADGRIGW